MRLLVLLCAALVGAATAVPWPMPWPMMMPPMMMPPPTTAGATAPAGAMSLMASETKAPTEAQETGAKAQFSMPMMPMMPMMPGMMMPPGALMMLAFRDAVMKHQQWKQWPAGKIWTRSDGKTYASTPSDSNVISLARAQPQPAQPLPGTTPPVPKAPAAKSVII